MSSITVIKKDTTLVKRFLPLYIAVFLHGIIFWYAIEKLFMTTIGLNSQAIAAIIIVFTALTLTVNVPIGILADRWSRKAVLMLASCFMITSCVVAGSSHGFGTYLIAACFAGLFYACYQGVYDSLTYDLLIEEMGNAKAYDHFRGKVQLYDGIALTIVALGSALIAHYLHFRAAYFLTIPFSLSALIALCYFKEPKVHKKEVNELVSMHIRSTFQAVFRKGEILWVVITLVFISIAIKLLLDFDQLWFVAIGLPVVLYGPFDAILLSSFTSGGFLNTKFTQGGLLIMSGCIALLSCFCLFLHQSILIIGAQTTIVTVMVLYSIVFEGYLHDNLASKIRVSAASVVSTIGGLLFLPVAYVFGRVSHQYNIFHATWVVIVIVFMTFVAGFKVIAQKSTGRRNINSTEKGH